MKNLAVVARTVVPSALLCILVTIGLAACGANGGSGSSATASAATMPDAGAVLQPATASTDPVSGTSGVSAPPAPVTPISGGAPASNLTISGAPVAAINVGSEYTFAPSATGPTGATLTFNIANKPVWASFNTASGALTGTPTAANAGTYANIIVSVSDGTASASLPAFTLTVDQSSNGAATLDWTPPTQNSDGTVLTNLAGYNVYYGTSAGNLAQTVKLTNPGLTAYMVSNLSHGTWYFAVSSYTAGGVESSHSGVISTTL